MKLEWGLEIPEGTFVRWGARAIFSGYRNQQPIQLVGDRQVFNINEGKVINSLESVRFIDWINKTFIPELIKWVKDNSVSVDSDLQFTLEGNLDAVCFKGIACPNKSYGYIYISCWLIYTLPQFCYAHSTTTGNPILIKRNESGYFEIEDIQDLDWKNFNEILGIQPEQVQAMINGCCFGWTVPAANPAAHIGKVKTWADIQNI